MQPSGNEGEDLRRDIVEPLCVVDHTEERTLSRAFREQRENGKPDEKTIGWRSEAQAERRPESFLLRQRKPLQSVHQRRAQLVETCKHQLQLRLDPGGVTHLHA